MSEPAKDHWAEFLSSQAGAIFGSSLTPQEDFERLCAQALDAVRAAEREACAEIVDRASNTYFSPPHGRSCGTDAARNIAAAIRARGQFGDCEVKS